MISSIICRHAYHLFQSPLCCAQSVLRRILNIVFHILTLGLPFLFYHVVAYCIDSEQKSVLSKSLLKYGQESILAVKKLSSKISFKGQWNFWDKKVPDYQPHYINNTVSLYWEYAFKNFKTALKENQQNPWKNKNVVKAADDLLKVSYTLFEYTIASLPVLQKALIDRHAANDDSSSSESDDSSSSDQTLPLHLFLRELLSNYDDEDLYAMSTIYYCAYTYTWIRYGVIWDNQKNCFVFPQEKEMLTAFINEEEFQYKNTQGQIDIFNIPAFYDKNTIQNDWRLLYNEYCDRLMIVLGYDEEAEDQDEVASKILYKDVSTEEPLRLIKQVVIPTIHNFQTLHKEL